MTARALEVLAGVHWIAAEDTRHTRRLLAHFGLTTPLFSSRAANEEMRARDIVARLARGETGALVVDAGSPAISDPGERVVRAAVEAGHTVRVVPGPSALVAALSVSGLSTAPFTFAGFLPVRAGARDRRLVDLLGRPETLVLYEAPHRVRATLEALARFAPGRAIAACRELTKLHEEVLRGSAEAILARHSAERERGEWVLVVSGSPDAATAATAARASVANAPGVGPTESAADARARFIAAQLASGATPEEARTRAEFVLGPELRGRRPPGRRKS